MPNPTQGNEPRATLKHIADQVGVHVSTVSRALNPATQDLVARDLVERIAEAAKALDYRPNRMALGLRTRVSMTVGVVLPDISNATFPVLVQAIEATLATKQYSTLVAHAEAACHQDHGRCVRACAARRQFSSTVMPGKMVLRW